MTPYGVENLPPAPPSTDPIVIQTAGLAKQLIKENNHCVEDFINKTVGSRIIRLLEQITIPENLWDLSRRQCNVLLKIWMFQTFPSFTKKNQVVPQLTNVDGRQYDHLMPLSFDEQQFIRDKELEENEKRLANRSNWTKLPIFCSIL